MEENFVFVFVFLRKIAKLKQKTQKQTEKQTNIKTKNELNMERISNRIENFENYTEWMGLSSIPELMDGLKWMMMPYSHNWCAPVFQFSVLGKHSFENMLAAKRINGYSPK